MDEFRLLWLGHRNTREKESKLRIEQRHVAAAENLATNAPPGLNLERAFKKETGVIVGWGRERARVPPRRGDKLRTFWS